ncbi:MAG: sugar transporter [Rhodobacteraceae bacterium]|nr:sugar transporter [Paracoccaceae bacterium]
MTAVGRAVRHILALPEGRKLIAIAGPPAGGKSWLAEKVARRLVALGHTATVVPMDGFHLDNERLSETGLLARKGAPETFDAAGFVALVRGLKSGRDMTVPLFDRAADRVLPDADKVPADCRFVVVEGNYLLFDEDPWNQLAALWDISFFLDVPVAELRKRLVRRWRRHGLDAAAAEARADENDLPNALRVMKTRKAADLIF